MNTLQTLHAALSAERETKRLIIADWNQAEHRARQRQNELEAEIAALRAELAPLRETVGVAATASTCADDLSNWSKLVERADNSTRLERENAELQEDKARLDWLDTANQALNEAHGTKYGWKYDANHNRCQIAINDHNIPALSIRAAIDAARKEAQP